jgi:superfamily I DNA/RNA helicase
MAKRKFELPGIHELSKEQERAIRLPMEGCHLIVGGPGTGKTVVTLLKLRRHAQQPQKRESLFLVYNHLLHETARQLFGKGMNSSTWKSWFMSTYYEHMQEPIPKLESDSDFKPIDWQTVIENITEMDASNQQGKPFLFIDEGQDMPPQFYDALIRLGFENFYVVADQNQAITSENSSRQQLQDAFASDSDQVVELTQNYRNAFPVARLASAFYPGDPATPPLVLPPQSSSGQAPFLIEYGPGCRLVFETVIERILKLADRDPRKLVGIIAPSNSVREKYLNTIRQMAGSSSIKLDSGAPRVVTYAYGKKSDLKFDEGGIFVINAQSCKGLEFDTVFIADIHAFHCHPGIQDEKKRLFYVMVARARERVFLLKEADQHCPVDCILPGDPEIMKHWR